MQYRFRFDDVCLNTDLDNARELTAFLLKRFPGCEVMWCVSPMVFDMGEDADLVTAQRVYPAILNAHSDHSRFFDVDRVGVPDMPGDVVVASHGLIHVDHRLLTYGEQRMSILTSCSLVKSSIFVPPFNKWNFETEHVCDEYGIELIKFRDGWQGMEHEPWEPECNQWYMHSRYWSVGKLKMWLGVKPVTVNVHFGEPSVWPKRLFESEPDPCE